MQSSRETHGDADVPCEAPGRHANSSTCEVETSRPTVEELGAELLHEALKNALLKGLKRTRMDDNEESKIDDEEEESENEIYRQALFRLQILSLADKWGPGGGKLVRLLIKHLGLDKVRFDCLIPAVEEELQSHRTWLAGLLGSSDVDSLVVETRLLIDSFYDQQQLYTKTVTAVTDALLQYQDELQAFGEMQARFCQNAKLESQKELVEMQSLSYREEASAMLQQYAVTETRLLAFDYTPQSIQALKKVNENLITAEADVNAKFRQMTERLQAYEELGPEFKKVADDYRQVLSDTQQIENDIAELTEGTEYTP